MTMFTDVRAVTFDCWGTLIYETDAGASMRARAHAIVDATGLDLTAAEELMAQSWQVHWETWTRGEQFGSVGAVAWMAQRTAMSEAAQARLLEVFEEAALINGVKAVDGAIDTLSRLNEHGIRTALVCDTGLTPGRIVRRLLEREGLTLDAHAFSDEVGVPKPHKKMFSAALDAIGGGPAVHIGDLRRTDIAGARSYGLGAVRFRGVNDDDSDHPEGDAVVDDLRQLLELIGIAS